MWIIRVASIIAITAGASGASEPPEWLEGEAFYKQLASPLGASWSGVPLGDVAAGLARTHKLAIVLDRRADPGQTVSLDVFDRPLIDVLIELARVRNLTVYLHGPIVILIPPEAGLRMEGGLCWLFPTVDSS